MAAAITLVGMAPRRSAFAGDSTPKTDVPIDDLATRLSKVISADELGVGLRCGGPATSRLPSRHRTFEKDLENPLSTKFCLNEEIERYGWSIGDHTYGAPLVFDYEYGDLTIGRFCSIAPGVSFILGNHRTDLVSTYPFKVLSDYWPGAEHAEADHEDRGGINVGSDVWLGAHCTVLTGVRIGSGSVVAANSVVTKDVPPYAIVAGNPGRIVRYRCSETQIRDLLAIAWWDWPDEKIRLEIPYLTTLSVDAFVERHKNGS